MVTKIAPSEDTTSPDILKSPGEVLKKERLLKKKSLHAVATDLCINERYLKNIEDMKTSDLPERVYTLGFIKTYALYLELDPTPLLEAYGNYLEGHPIYHSPISQEVAPKIRPKWYHFIFAVGGLILAGGLWVFLSKEPPSENSAPPREDLPRDEKEVSSFSSMDPEKKSPHLDGKYQGSPSTSSVSDGESSSPHNTALSQDTNLEGAEQGETLPQTPFSPKEGTPFVFKATEKTWIELRNEHNQVIYTKTLLPGEEYAYTPTSPTTFTTGNAGGLVIRQGTSVFKPLGKTGEVKRAIPLKASPDASATEGLLLSLT